MRGKSDLPTSSCNGDGFVSPASGGYQITKGLPKPPRAGSRKYPFPEMEVGDSFFAADASILSLHGCARLHRPKKFSCRTVVEGGLKGVRVWRVL